MLPAECRAIVSIAIKAALYSTVGSSATTPLAAKCPPILTVLGSAKYSPVLTVLGLPSRPSQPLWTPSPTSSCAAAIAILRSQPLASPQPSTSSVFHHPQQHIPL
ncbi:uncharacterized protein EDB93DRAFT_1253847 [Suillus bovinus]|uniref:uncharacterized protein n=1 Tax=Suillus bovinus TaxID=48563 RepID=UPI001B8840B0|nr:uncharacterized protein EDB93DRAFT_1253847 [Suillus bovinus]KAG2136550.1 hypothetical protein EDB93DRAFT_1253847 [Suillus bovinus]